MGLFSWLGKLFGGGSGSGAKKKPRKDERAAAASPKVQKVTLTAKHYQEDIAAGFTSEEPEHSESALGEDSWFGDSLEQAQPTSTIPVRGVDHADGPVLVADLDGTLMGDPTSKYRKQFLPKFVERMAELKETMSMVFVLNSGATYDRILETLNSQPVPIWPDHLLLRESEIYHLVEPGRYIEHQPYNDESRKLRADAITAIKQQVSEWAEEWSRAVQIVKWQMQRYEVVIMLPDADQALVLRDIIRKQLRFARNVSVMSNRRVVAITCNLFNKKVVLEELLRHRGWEPTQVMAIGDDVNDLPILDGRLALACCPGNAVDAVKQLVTSVDGYVAETGYGDGALEAMEWFISSYGAKTSTR